MLLFLEFSSYKEVRSKDEEDDLISVLFLQELSESCGAAVCGSSL